MEIAHTGVVRAALGSLKLAVISDVFNELTGEPPRLNAQRYRACHVQWFKPLDELENGQLFLARHRNGSDYTVRAFALPLIEDSKADAILEALSGLLPPLRSLYSDRFNIPVSVREILALSRFDSTLTKDALYYLLDLQRIHCGYSDGFPYNEDATLCIAESVLQYEHVGSIFDEFYEYWFIAELSLASGAPVLSGETTETPTSDRVGTWISPDADSFEWLSVEQRRAINEIELAVGHGLCGLAAMGIRALIELLVLSHIDDRGAFPPNLEALEEAGYITRKDCELIKAVVEAGHAAIHRGYVPDSQTLATCLAIVKHLINALHLRTRIDPFSDTIPPRRHRENASR